MEGKVESMTPEDELRGRAIQRLKEKKVFWGSFATFLFVWALCWLVWFVTGAEVDDGHVPWPTWLAFWGIWVVFHGIRVYWNSGKFDGEAAVQREMEKLRGR